MGAVGVKEAAAVCPQHLDGFLRSNRALGDGLRLALDGVGRGVGVQVLRNALADQE